MIGRIIICSILCSGYVNAFPSFLNAVLITCAADKIFGYVEEL